MTDPVYALMLMGILGPQYYVWDKQADINFIRPGATDLVADFVIPEDVLNTIIHDASSGEKVLPEFFVKVKNKKGDVVAEVRRVLYVRKKPQYRENGLSGSAMKQA